MTRAPAIAALLALTACFSPPDHAVVAHPALVRQSEATPAAPAAPATIAEDAQPEPDVELTADRMAPRPRADRSWQGIRPELSLQPVRRDRGWRWRAEKAQLNTVERRVEFDTTPRRYRAPQSEVVDRRRESRLMMLDAEERALRFRLKSDLFGSGGT